MGRREEREAMQRTWTVYEPAVRGAPIRAKDMEAADGLAPQREALHRPPSASPSTGSVHLSSAATLIPAVIAAARRRER